MTNELMPSREVAQSFDARKREVEEIVAAHFNGAPLEGSADRITRATQQGKIDKDMFVYLWGRFVGLLITAQNEKREDDVALLKKELDTFEDDFQLVTSGEGIRNILSGKK